MVTLPENRSGILKSLPFPRAFLVVILCTVLLADPAALFGEVPSYRGLSSIASRLSAPTGVATDSAGRLYVTESSSGRLLVFSPDGAFLREKDGLARPLGVAVSSGGKIFVGSAGRGRVEVFDRDLAPLYALGQGDREFSLPLGIAVDGRGVVYVADGKADRIRVYDGAGDFLFSFGERGDADGQFRFPAAVASDDVSQEIVVTDLPATPQGDRGARVQVFSRDGIFKRRFASFGVGEGLLVKPLGVAVDGAGRIFVSDAYQNVVQAFDGSGAFLFAVHDPAHPVRTPLGIAVGQTSGKLYVASQNTARVVVFGEGDGDPGGGGGNATLTFETGGGGSCSVGGRPSRNGDPLQAALLLLPLAWMALRQRFRVPTGEGPDRGRRMRSGSSLPAERSGGRMPRGRWMGILAACCWFAGTAAAAPMPVPASAAVPLASTSGSVLYPHIDSREYKTCEECHFLEGTNPSLMPDWAVQPAADNDDTIYNNLCRHCHNDIVAPFARTHSSLTTTPRYGDWHMECRTCHNPHHQDQAYAYGSAGRILEGIVQSLSDNALTATAGGWTDNQYRGLLLIPNLAEPYFSYRIERNDGNTLYTASPMHLGKVAPGDGFGVAYGKLVRTAIAAPSGETREVRLFRDAGANSLADGDANYDGVCEVCHTKTASYRCSAQGNSTHRAAQRCTQCHSHAAGFKTAAGGAHSPHLPLLSCDSGNQGCHGAYDPPLLGDGLDLAGTAKCNNCHAAGASSAKSYWGAAGTESGWRNAIGEQAYCGTCHNDASPGNTEMDGGGDWAPSVNGNGTSYGFYVTGHGRPSGSYARLSWQSVSATGNPAANLACGSCHDLTSAHFRSPGKRLRAGYENDAGNGNCRQCHDPGTAAAGAPAWYTTYGEYANSAHGLLKCTDCHDVHGASGTSAGMTTANRQNLCLSAGCHTGMSGHALGAAYGRAGLAYTLECVSCHNVHIVTGRITAADPTKTPMTRIDNNLLLWGGSAGQKMSDFAGSGTYRTPSGDTLTGAQLPDYPSFCLQCHGGAMSPSIHGNISWGEMHGTGTAGSPSGGGTCPDWYTCGRAGGWDGDACTGTEEECWPVVTRGKGDQIWSRNAYAHEERIAGANFVLSCSDCHVTHESGIGRKLRATINGNPGSTSYNTLCNACHYYYSDWHAGMSCGNAGCHNSGCSNSRGSAFCDSNTLHGQSRGGGGGGFRSFDNTLVVDMRFENNLNDSGSWRMHGVYRLTNSTGGGAYAAGRFGQAVVLDNTPIEVGTRNSSWSTDEGAHGTWKYTEMKHRMTLEAWVYPTNDTADERKIMAKHTYTDGGYALVLKKVDGTLRAGLLTNVNGGGTKGVWDGADCNGLRGAFGRIPVPLNQWTHVAAVYDNTAGDRDPSDGSVGRIRIYANGEDVTTSFPSVSQCYAQPGAGETDMFPYSMHNDDPVGVCYNDSWCASALSIGGVNWSDNAANFVGRLDEAKVWNVAKDADYFLAADSQSPPRVSFAEGMIGSDRVVVTFSEGVYAGPGGAGALLPSGFVLTDADDGRTITGVVHTAGGASATLTLSAPLDEAADILVDTVAAAPNSVYDEFDNAAGSIPVAVSPSSACPSGPVLFPLNELPGSAFVMDNQTLLYGKVYGSSSLTGDEFQGDGTGSYIDFEYNAKCLQATTGMTLEARFQAFGLEGAANYITRVLAHDTGGNFQLSVWRNNGNANFPGFSAPDNVASIAFWVNPADSHGGNAWKPVLTDYGLCPIVSDHWYEVKVVWNSSKPGGTPGQFFVPADIFVDDQGIDGSGAGERWTGVRNCTHSGQSYHLDAVKLWTGDEIRPNDGAFTIGANVNNHANNLFNGLIDWIRWERQ